MKNWKLFGVVALVAIAAFALYLVFGRDARLDGANTRTPVPGDDAALRAQLLATAGRIVYRHTAPDSHYGELALLDASVPSGPTFVSSLGCESVYVAAGRGICLAADRGVLTTYAAKLFDARTFEVRGELPLEGVPSRSRVSQDGQLAASTVFVSGHGYGDVGFSTQTLILATQSATVVADVERDFKVLRDGKPFREEDFNFWGVTFTPDGRGFYATLSTGREHYLVAADLASRTAQVVSAGVECPSLSPDGQRVAFKRRRETQGRVEWDLHVMELASGEARSLSETRSVDDQLEWLGNEHVLYSIAGEGASSAATTDVWAVAVDGTHAPVRLLANAYSPAVIRDAATAQPFPRSPEMP